MTQGDPAPPIIFNIVVHAVVWELIDVVCSPQEVQHGIVWAAGERNPVFYSDYGMILGQDHEWVQDALIVTVEIFRRTGLDANLNNIKAMVCTPGFVWGKWRNMTYKHQLTGEGNNFRERKKTRVSCIGCNTLGKDTIYMNWVR